MVTFGKVKKVLAVLLAVLFVVSLTAASATAKCGASHSNDKASSCSDPGCKSCDKDKSCGKDKPCKDKSCKDKKTCGKDKHKHNHKHKHSHKKSKCPYSN